MSTLVNNSALMIAGATANQYYPANYPAIIRFDGTNTISATTYSVPILVQYCDRLSVHVSCPGSGSPNGIVTIQGSNDVGLYEAQATPFTGGPVETGGAPISDPNILNWATLAVWNELTFAYAANTTVTGATSVMLTVQQCAARWVRVVWTNPSGSALLTLRVQQKSIGGR